MTHIHSDITHPHDELIRHNPRWFAAWEEFIARAPRFAETVVLDEVRESELRRVIDAGQTYLDYTGAGQYPALLPVAHAERLTNGVFGNPHSLNPASSKSTELVEAARRRILDYFDASPEEYEVIFTPNASGAIRLVGESFPWTADDTYLLTWDNHNSVNGIREFAKRRGASVRYAPLVAPDLRLDEAELSRALAEGAGSNKLFAYPAQSNFSGVKHPLEWIERAQTLGWRVLLDAAAFAPTNRLDLSVWHPDFVCVSFYKMFGFPTGIGALIAKRAALAELERPWFSGGSIEVVSVQIERFLMAAPPERFEDGTLDFINIPAIVDGLDFIHRIGIDTIHDRVEMLTDWLLARLSDLQHSNRQPLVTIYGPLAMVDRGGTIAFNLHDSRGEDIGQDPVEERATSMGISLRTGCFCNPGAAEAGLGLSKDAINACLDRLGPGTTQEEFRHCLGKATGAVRISLGWGSSFSDVCRAIDLLHTFVE